MSTRLLGLGLADYGRRKNFTDSLFQSAALYLTGWGSMTHAFEVKHLDGYHMEYQQFLPHDASADHRWCPIPEDAVKEVYGREIPPSVAEDYEKIGMKLTPGTYKAKASGGKVSPEESPAEPTEEEHPLNG